MTDEYRMTGLEPETPERRRMIPNFFASCQQA